MWKQLPRNSSIFMLAALLLAVCVQADDDGRGDGSREHPFVVPRIDQPISIDGALDEAVWEQALVIELKYEVRPGENIPAPVRTECLLAYDESTLYVGFRAFDPEPEAIRAHLMDRDSAWTDDWVAVVLDTFNDERRTLDFFSNPLGVQMDEIETSTSEDASWDAIWDSAGQIHDWGYAVEMAIPFDQLRFQRTDGEQTWGFDAVRRYPRSVMHHLGSFPRDRNNNCYFCQMIKIRGFAGADPGRSIEITPTVTAVRTDARSDIPGGDFQRLNQDAEVGVTARWGLTPNMTLQGTANPDFSQVEADALQLDINQPFALYYSERRPFFTEGADFFDTYFAAVYTRSMRDPAWGVKLTGKEGDNTVGAYVVHDDITNLIFPGAYGSSSHSMASSNMSSVFRYRRDIWNNSTVGVLMTDREGTDYHNRLLSVDGRLRFTDNDRLTFQVMGSSTHYPDDVAQEYGQPLGDFSDLTWMASFRHSTRDYYAYVSYEDIGTQFRADLGFMTWIDYTEIEVGGGYNWYFDNDDLFNRVSLYGNWNYTSTQSGGLIENEAEGGVSLEGLMQSYINLHYGQRERGYAGFEFDETFFNCEFSFRPISSVRTGFWATTRDELDYAHARAGKRNYISTWSNVNLSRNVNVQVDYEFNHLAVGGQRLFMTNSVDARIVYQFDRRTFVRAILQYVDIRRNQGLYAFDVDAHSQSLFTQLLFSYKINPRTVLFVGYSDNYFGNQDFSILQTDRSFFVKLGYAWTL